MGQKRMVVFVLMLMLITSVFAMGISAETIKKDYDIVEEKDIAEEEEDPGFYAVIVGVEKLSMESRA